MSGNKEQRSGSTAEHGLMVAAELPWGAVKTVPASLLDPAVQPGQFAAQTLIVDFVMVTEKKLNSIMHEPLEKHLTKTMQRGEDTQFDNIIRALSGVSEHCLPSVVRSLICWYDEQKQACAWMLHCKAQTLAKHDGAQVKQMAKNEVRYDAKDFLIEKRSLAVDFLICLALIEILPQLYLHPGHDEQIKYVISLAFKQFKYKEPSQVGPNMSNSLIIADLYAEVIGALAQSRFHAVRSKFTQELHELRHEKDNPLTNQNIIGLLMGMKFFRVKTNQIEDLETGISFLHELGVYFVEVKDRDIKHHIAGLLVEILLPVAAQVKTETNIPSLISFVELLYSHTLDLASKKKHQLAAFPLLTCLLCISQTRFFLANWHYFLTLTLSNLKSKDPKMSRVALESLYRLLWVYVIRIRCESNTATHSRLQSICNSLFPKGGRGIIPREAPLNIFVKIIHFIAQEKLDFAFKEIIFDLLCVGRMVRTVYPERMNIGLRALMVIADGLQQKEGPPGMPRGHAPVASGTIQRIKKTYLTHPLSADVARAIGLDQYYGPCRRAFDGILRALDLQVGRPMMLNVMQGAGKEPDEMLSGERKPKLDLMRTCVASIPRLLPEGMSHQDLIDLLARMTVHMDEELRGLACQTLQNLITECTDWREDVIHGFLQFITRDIQDGYPQLLDNALRLLLQLICAWKNHVQIHQRKDLLSAAPCANASRVQVSPLLNGNGAALVLHCVEGLALVMLCQGRSSARKLAANLLKEVKILLPQLCGQQEHERPVLDVLDQATPYVVNKYIQHVPQTERSLWLNVSHVDFVWIADKVPTLEADLSLINAERGNEYLQWDAWAVALSGFTEAQFLLAQCPTATAYAWPLAYTRLNSCFSFVDPNNPQNDTRASLLRSSKSKATSMLCGEALNYSHYLSLWQKYLVLACAVAPPAANASAIVRSLSPVNLPNENGESILSTTRALELRIPRVANVSASNLFKWLRCEPLLRCEMTDMRDIMVLGLGSVNAASFECLLEELAPLLRDAAEKKQENVRRRRRRDLLRLQLIRLFEVVMFRGTLPLSSMLDSNSGQLKPVLLDFVHNARQYLESDQDRDVQIFTQMRLHFAKMVTLLINGLSVEKRLSLLPSEKKHDLFFLFTSWCSRLALALDRKHSRDRDTLSWVEHHSVSASCAVLCCGSVFESNKALGDEGYLYGWLDALMTSQNEKVQPLSEETLALLLDFNAEMAQLLDWVIDRCYATESRVADKCFRALASVFAQREYPCDIVSMFALTLMYAGYPVVHMQQVAIELIQVLEQRYFGHSAMPYNADENIDNSSKNEVIHAKWSQLYLSQQLAEMHPEMTMPIFSEVSLRLEAARPARQSAMLSYLSPWLYNVELVDTSMEPCERTVTLSLGAKLAESQAQARRVLKGEGWGTRAATEMILNNMLYITVKFGNEHASLIEQLWCSLIIHWPANLRVIVRYLAVVATLAPENLLPFVKRIIVYLARVNPERLIDELINELQTIDTFRCPLERTEMAPFYRWGRRTEDERTGARGNDDRDGRIHTRRHTPSDTQPDEDSDFVDEEMMIETDQLDPSASLTSLVTLKADILNAKPATPTMESEPKWKECDPKQPECSTREYLHPFQLPMPAYGGHYCSLNVYLPECNQAVLPLYRSNLALLLLTDLVIADVDIEWTVHLPLILHMATLGLDAARTLVCEHCKQLLLNLTVVHSAGHVIAKDVASVLLTNSLAPSQQLACSHAQRHSASENRWDSVNSRASTVIVTDSGNSSRSETPAPSEKIPSVDLLEESSSIGSLNQLVVSMAQCLAASKLGVLWQSEDVTAKSWRIESGAQLCNFVLHLSRLFAHLQPAARIEARWAQTALHVALCCSNRHLAGRSFQIFRALRTAPSSRQLSDILSRLVETVGEQYDEQMQGYVSEIMLTLDSSVLHMEVAEHSLASLFRAEQQLVDGPPANQLGAVRSSPTHARSTSYSVAPVRQRMSPAQDRRDARNSTGSDELNAAYQAQQQLPRSQSAQALKSVPEGEHEEHLAAMAQLFWIATSMLDSDLEHEFLLALHLLDKILDLPSFERQDCLDRLDRMTKQLAWSHFPGLLPLVLKGGVYPAAYEFSITVLVKLLPLVDFTVVDPDQTGLALIVASALPLFLIHYDNPTRLCVNAAETISQYCTELAEQTPSAEHPLEHLGVVLRLYSKKSFSKDCLQWTKCISKYLHDRWPAIDPQLLILLSEMLERNSSILHQPILQILYCLFQHLELVSAPALAINADVLRAVAKHIQGPHWRDAARIMKLTVTRSSSLSAPTAVGDAEGDMRRELAGRTMEFSVDIPALTTSMTATKEQQSTSDNASGTSPKKQPGGSGESSLRRQMLGQMRVREHLVSLLNASGLRVGLPKSPSMTNMSDKVIFSQSSHDIAAELPSSVYASSGELTGEKASTPSPEGGTLGTDYTSDSFPRVFKEFDFLEAEHDSVSESADSCFNWLSTLRPRSVSSSGDERNGAASPGLLHTAPSVPCQIDGHLVLRQSPQSDSSDEEESASSQAEEDSAECALTAHDMERLFVDNQTADQSDTRPTTPASASRLSLCGSVGTPSVEWSLSVGSLALALECTHHATGQVEESWTIAVAALLSDHEGTATANATLIFTQLYREACGKVSGLSRDACHFLSMSETFKAVAAQFLDSLDVLMRIGECPFLFVTPQMLRVVNLLHRQKFTLFELREHYETFQERREHCIRTLNGVKSSLKLQLMGQKVEEQSIFEQSIDLCRSLHKLFFQLMLMCESFNKMVHQLSSHKSQEQTSDLTADVRVLHRELLCAVNELSAGADCTGPMDLVAAAPPAQLVHLLNNRRYKQAVQHLRQCRSSQSNKLEVYGCCEEEDVEVLLLLYCKASAETQPSCVGVVGSESAFSEGCQQLLEMDLQLSATVRALASPRR